MAISDILNAGRSSLIAQQRALKVNGNNIANVNTPGYTRQRPVLEAVPTSAGGGVRVADVEQIVDRFVETRLLGQSSTAAGASARRDLLEGVQSLFPVGDASVSGALQDFFAAANELSAHPEDLAVRNDLLDRAETLAGKLRSSAEGLGAVQREADDRVTADVADANGILSRIADLNRSIRVEEVATGSSANELRDQRRSALGDLAKLVGIRTVENDDGSVDVYARSGVALVSGSNAARLEARLGTTLGLDGAVLHDVGVVAPDASLIPLGSDPGGSIGARLGVRDDELVAQAGSLDAIAVTLRDAVNGVQTDPAGRDLDGLVGSALFAGTGAADLTVALTDPRGIAAAQSTTGGDNANALALANLQTTTFAGLSGQTLSGAMGALQSDVGASVRNATDAATIEDGLLANVQAQRDSVSGVTLEEEFTDLIRFQRAFQAAAQLISVGDSMLQELLGMVR
jgi:flagellar hook-associated protein 1 FlgK